MATLEHTSPKCYLGFERIEKIWQLLNTPLGNQNQQQQQEEQQQHPACLDLTTDKNEVLISTTANFEQGGGRGLVSMPALNVH